MVDKDVMIEHGSGNVFADLGFDNADEMAFKAHLALAINDTIEKHKLTQSQAATLMRVDQAKVSAIKHGRIDAFSVDRLIRFLALLGRDIEVRVARRKRDHVGRVSVKATAA